MSGCTVTATRSSDTRSSLVASANSGALRMLSNAADFKRAGLSLRCPVSVCSLMKSHAFPAALTTHTHRARNHRVILRHTLSRASTKLVVCVKARMREGEREREKCKERSREKTCVSVLVSHNVHKHYAQQRKRDYLLTT